MTPRGRRVVAMCLAVALVLGAMGALIPLLASLGGDGPRSGGSAPRSFTLPEPEEGAQEPPAPELASFYSQTLEWERCRDAFWCTTVEVPVDYADPAGDTIDLAVLVAPARGERLGALVVNPGGPGSPGTDYAELSGQAFTAPVRERYDIVGFDPRGTGGSSPVDCLSDPALDAFIAADPVPDTPAEEADYLASSQRFGAGCTRHSGDLAAHVSTVEAARDLDVLRAALGESELDYFGASYGTKLGATYADLFPDRAGRLVLDGAVDLSLPARQFALEQAQGFETALRAYVASCQAGDDCPLEGDVDAGLEQIRQLLDRIDAQALPTSSGRELAVGNAFYGLVTPLYAEQSWPVLTTALAQAFDGKGDMLLLLSDLYSSRSGDGRGYDNNSSEAIYAINCLDDPWAITADQVPEHLPDFLEASPTFGDVFAWGLTGCAGLQVRSAEPPREVRAAGAPPILVIGTTRDPATPYRWAQALAEQLESGVLLTRDGDGHTAYGSGNACIDTTVEEFLIEGVVPADGTSC